MAECFPLPSSTFALTGVRSVPVRAPIQVRAPMQPEVSVNHVCQSLRPVWMRIPSAAAELRQRRLSGPLQSATYGASANARASGEAGAKATSTSASAASLARSSVRSVPVGGSAADAPVLRSIAIANGELAACDGLQHLPSSAVLHEHTPRHTASSQYLITEENDISDIGEYIRDGEKGGLRNASHMELGTLDDAQRQASAE